MKYHKNYHRAKNNHIFIQLTLENIPDIREIVSKRNQRIHIFEIYPGAVINLLNLAIETAGDKAKVVIHIPKRLRDWVPVILDSTKDIKQPYCISIDGDDVLFYLNDNSWVVIQFGTSRDIFYINATTTIHGCNFMLPVMQYDTNNAILNTYPKLSYPELFKKEIIKIMTKDIDPKILENFKDEDDLWEFLKQDILEQRNHQDNSEEYYEE